MAKKTKKDEEEGVLAEELEPAEDAAEAAEEDTEETVEGEPGSAEESEEAAEGTEKPEKKRKEKKAVKKRKSKKEKENPLARAVRMAVETGKVEFGAKTGMKDSLLGKAKLIVVASNAPGELQEDISQYAKLSGAAVLTFEGTSMELGSICGKPYPVSVLSVYDAGSSDIMELTKKK
ncbi:50S ribosomal protein L30e [uncultured archaeon]|nr:50S ribosomal protein L30e [uncultured archaeon]